MIVEGRLAAGTRVHEGKLCEQLGVSRTPLREALKVLAGEGLVELLPNRGAVVREVTPKDTRDMLRVLGRLEGLAGELACREASDAGDRRGEGRCTTACSGTSPRATSWSISSSTRRSTAPSCAVANNETLRTTHETLQARVKRIRFVPHDFHTDSEQPVREHERMMEALMARDGKRLGDLLNEHLEMTWVRVSKSLGLAEP